jgi:hypothetical protein
MCEAHPHNVGYRNIRDAIKLIGHSTSGVITNQKATILPTPTFHPKYQKEQTNDIVSINPPSSSINILIG